MASIYEIYRNTPPVGKGTRISSAYHVGYEHPELRCPYPFGSLAWESWKAGRDNARQDVKRRKR
jgi:hypothetical protein